jgi:hypothetical protein
MHTSRRQILWILKPRCLCLQFTKKTLIPTLRPSRTLMQWALIKNIKILQIKTPIQVMTNPRLCKFVFRWQYNDSHEIPFHVIIFFRICPFLIKSGFCRYETCAYVHGELCDMCGRFCLDPLDGEQRKKHEKECIAAHEKEMEIAFSIQRSKEKTCGICFDVVWDKVGKEQRFGILPNCCHCFCLECIRTWRQAKQFENKIIRACPECRVCSDFVCPSSFWVDSKDEKEKLISKYKNALSEKDCKYFKKVRGRKS